MNIKQKYLAITFLMIPILFFGFVLLGILLSRTISPFLGSSIAFIGLIAFAVAGQMIGNIRCPKCHAYLFKRKIFEYRFALPDFCPECNLDLLSTKKLIFNSPEEQKKMSNGEKDFIVALIFLLGTIIAMFVFINNKKTITDNRDINLETLTIDTISSESKE